MTQRRRIELLFLAVVLWFGATSADRHYLPYVAFAFVVAGIVAALLGFSFGGVAAIAVGAATAIWTRSR